MTILRDEQLKNRASIAGRLDRFLYCPKGPKSYLFPTQALLAAQNSLHVPCGLRINSSIPSIPQIF